MASESVDETVWVPEPLNGGSEEQDTNEDRDW